jgi:hypothetical protein
MDRTPNTAMSNAAALTTTRTSFDAPLPPVGGARIGGGLGIRSVPTVSNERGAASLPTRPAATGVGGKFAISTASRRQPSGGCPHRKRDRSNVLPFASWGSETWDLLEHHRSRAWDLKPRHGYTRRMPGEGHAHGPNEREGGSKGIGLAIAGIIVGFFATLPFIFIVVLYMFLTIYAIVRAVGPGAGENPVVIVVGFVLITSVFAILLGVTIHFAGRSLTPKKLRGKA